MQLGNSFRSFLSYISNQNRVITMCLYFQSSKQIIVQLNLWMALGGSGAKCDMGFFYSMICTRKTRLVPPERSVKAKIALVTTFHITVYITSDSKKFEPHIKAYLSISLNRIIVLAPSIPHFKGIGMRNLQYLIGICQKSHNTVTNHIYILCVV